MTIATHIEKGLAGGRPSNPTPGSTYWATDSFVLSVADGAGVWREVQVGTALTVFYVGSAVSGATDAAGYGLSADLPFATIDYAIGQCTANRGDVILVLPGHSESINTAGGITCDVAGVSIVGLGNGADMPLITVGTSLDTATILISAADVRLANLEIVPGNDGVDILIDINADGAIIEDCNIHSDEANAYQADTYIDINGGGANAADRAIIRRNKISSITAGANQAIEIGAVQAGLRVEDNWIEGDFAVAGIHSASVLTNCLVARNYIHNVNAGDWCIEFSAAATGLLVDNRFYADGAATTLDPGSMMCVNNFMVNAIDQSSIPVPTTAGGALPTGAIGAGSFAAGAIDAAAIANGAIDAATFAAGAIDAAAIADDAIDGAALADDFGAWRLARSDWDFAVDTGVAAAYTVFTVSGNVLLQIFAICQTTITAGGAITIELGVAGNTAVFIAQIVDGRDLLANEIWIDATPTTTVEAVDIEGTKTFIVSNGQDVSFLIGAGGLTAGKINFYALWKPLSAGATVVAA